MLTVKTFVFSPVQENTYVLSDEKDACCIIDPGCYFGNERRELQEYVEQQGLTPKMLVNTHCHLDHVFGNKFVYDTWGLPLHLHEKERLVLEMAPLMGRDWGMPFENYRGPQVLLEPGKKYPANGPRENVTRMPERSNDGRPSEDLFRHGPPRSEPSQSSVLDDGPVARPGRLQWGEDELEILFLPGHSPGSVGFYCAEQGFLIAGDTLFRDSIGRTDLPGGDHMTLLKSIREVLWALPDETVVYPGHGEETTIGWEKRHNPFIRG